MCCSDLLAELSDVRIASCTDTNSALIGAQDAVSIRSRLIDNDDDDDDSFTHSGALTIKSSRQSPSNLFTNVGHGTESSPCLSYGEQLRSAKDSPFGPAVDNHNNNINDYSCSNAPYLGPIQQSAVSPDNCGLIRESRTDLRIFLVELGLGKYADVFHEQDVDLPMFLTLNEDDLKEIGIR